MIGRNGLRFVRRFSLFATSRVISWNGAACSPVDFQTWSEYRRNSLWLDRVAQFCGFRGGATPSWNFGVNWLEREFFVEHPDEFARPFLPPNRRQAHINEVEYLTEVMRTAAWDFPRGNLVICGIADNSVSNMWYLKGKARSGAGLQLTRTSHRWLIEQRTRLYSFYCRSEHNATADFLSRAGDSEIHQWAIDNAMTRIDPRKKWNIFTLTTLPPWPTWENAAPVSLPLDSNHFQGVEWKPGPYTICQAGANNGIRFHWVDPRHTRISRAISPYRSEFVSGPVHFIGGVAKDSVEIAQFMQAFTSFQFEQGVLMTPKFVELPEGEPLMHNGHWVMDSALYGDVIAALWNIYAFGKFGLDRFKQIVQLAEPQNFAH